MMNHQQFQQIPNDGQGNNSEFNKMILNMGDAWGLLSEEEAEIMRLMLSLNYDGQYDLWVNSEFDSNQSPMEFIFNNNHLAVKARTNIEAAVMINIVNRIMAWWNNPRRSDRQFDWIYNELEIAEQYPNIEYPDSIHDFEDYEFRKFVDVFAKSRLGHVSLLTESTAQTVRKWPNKYRDTLEFLYRRICDPMEGLGVITKESLLVFLERYG